MSYIRGGGPDFPFRFFAVRFAVEFTFTSLDSVIYATLSSLAVNRGFPTPRPAFRGVEIAFAGRTPRMQDGTLDFPALR